MKKINILLAYNKRYHRSHFGSSAQVLGSVFENLEGTGDAMLFFPDGEEVLKSENSEEYIVRKLVEHFKATGIWENREDYCGFFTDLEKVYLGDKCFIPSHLMFRYFVFNSYEELIKGWEIYVEDECSKLTILHTRVKKNPELLFFISFILSFVSGVSHFGVCVGDDMVEEFESMFDLWLGDEDTVLEPLALWNLFLEEFDNVPAVKHMISCALKDYREEFGDQQNYAAKKIREAILAFHLQDDRELFKTSNKWELVDEVPDDDWTFVEFNTSKN